MYSLDAFTKQYHLASITHAAVAPLSFKTIQINDQSTQGFIHTVRLSRRYFCFCKQFRALSSVLEAEKTSRSDMELYVAVLNKQKNVMQEDNDVMRDELREGQS